VRAKGFNPTKEVDMPSTDKLLKTIRQHRTKPNAQAWVEQAAAWRLNLETKLAKTGRSS